MDKALQERIDSRGISSIVTRLELIISRIDEGIFSLRQVINYHKGNPVEIVERYEGLDQVALGIFRLKRVLIGKNFDYRSENLSQKDKIELGDWLIDYIAQDYKCRAAYGVGNMRRWTRKEC